MENDNQNETDTSGESEPEAGVMPQQVRATPHWQALLGLIIIGLLYGLLPVKVSLGPRGFLLGIEALFILPFVIAVLARRSIRFITLRSGSLSLLGIVTLTLVVGIGRMLVTLKKDLNGIDLLVSGVLLYGCNILLFALWYWEIDGGGPERRRLPDPPLPDFQFPQQMSEQYENWVPRFYDYLYVGFTGATAFSPTDTMPMTHRAKLLMALEAIMSLILLSFVIARSINIIP